MTSLFTPRTSVAYFILVLISCLFYNPVYSGAVQLTSDNFDTLLGGVEAGLVLFGAEWCPFSSALEPVFDAAYQHLLKTYHHEVVFLNFYADWCRFSQILSPIFEEAADKVAAVYPEPGKALFGKVDCDDQTALAGRFHILKYPTIKVIINGQIGKKEYRGQRSAEALATFVIDLLKDPVKQLPSFKDVETIDLKARAVIGYFESKETPQYKAFQKMSKSLRDYCEFHAGFSESVQDQRPNGTDVIIFRPSHTKYGQSNVQYFGNLLDSNEMSTWATELCIPLVREITFENAEEFAEEGLPFLILFHNPDDNDIVNQYTAEVKKQLSNDKGSINCLTADGVKFSHPLHHLGKTQKDMPIIAIDTFRHMYLFPDITQLSVPGKLKQFVDDLYSGKLHREFHYGPDRQEVAYHPDKTEQQTQDGGSQATNPPESTFKKLAPSKTRYTLLRDEL